MKKFGLGLVQFLLFIVLLFLIVSLSACNLKGKVAINSKDLIMDQINELKGPNEDCQIADTSKKEQLTGDFRYDYLLK